MAVRSCIALMRCSQANYPLQQSRQYHLGTAMVSTVLDTLPNATAIRAESHLNLNT